MNRDISRRIDDLESRMGLAGTEGWKAITCIVIGGKGGGFSYAQHIKSGQRSFDRAFIDQIKSASGTDPITQDDVRLIIGHDPEYQAVVQEAIAAGVIDQS